MDDLDTVRDLLSRADTADLERLADVLDRFPRTSGLAAARLATDPDARPRLEALIARALGEAASADVSRAIARVRRQPSRPNLQHAVTGAAARLGVRVPRVGTLHGRLAALATAVIDKTILAMTPEEQAKIFGHEREALSRCVAMKSAIDASRGASLPMLHHALGAEVVGCAARAALAQATALVVGRETARACVRAVMTRVPIVTTVLGPAAWAVGGAWTLWELQGPAQRKVVPALLYLGLVATRTPRVTTRDAL